METLVKEYSKNIRNLRMKKVVVRPIRRKGGWVPPDHDSAFMNDGSRMGMCVPVLAGNILSDPFKSEELGKADDNKTIGLSDSDKELLANELGLKDVQAFNVHSKGKECFWRGNTVFIDRNGLHLDLSITDHFIKYLILLSDRENIAPNWAVRFNRGTYKFALVEEGEELLDKVSRHEDKKNAYIHLSKIDKSATKMTDFLYVYYLTKKDAKKPPRTANLDWLKNELGRIIEDDLQSFLEILDDKDYTLKLLIQRSLECGALIRQKHNYSLPGSDRPIGVIEDLLEFLDSSKGQETRMKLMHMVEQTNKK